MPNYRRYLRIVLLAADRRLSQIARGLRYVAMGTVHWSELRTGIERAWTDYNISDAEIANGFVLWESVVAQRFVCPTDRILIVGSGTGRDALALARMGCVVTGIDPVASACAAATRALDEHRRNATIICGFFEDVVVEGTFDVVWFSNQAYSYILGAERRAAALQKAKAHLACGGRIVVSLIGVPELPQSQALPVIRAVGRICRSGWRIEEGDELTTRGATRDLFGFEHLFRRGEFEREAMAAGLQVRDSLEYGSVFVLSADPP